MKILYVGDEDNLSNGIMERLIKEGNDIYLLTTQLSLKAKRDKIKYKYYLNNGVEDVKNVFISVKPEVVIFVGNGYMQEIWNEEQNNLSLLAVALEESKSLEIEKFIFFSSTEVYSDQIEDIDEQSQVIPKTLKETWLLQSEDMIEMYRKYYDLNTVILRIGIIFGNQINLTSNDYFGNLYQRASAGSAISEEFIQPIHILDVADAVKRVMVLSESPIYNVCSSSLMKKSVILEFLGSEKKYNIQENHEVVNRKISNDRIKKEQEWVDFWSLETLIKNDKIQVVEKTHEEMKKNGKKSKMKTEIRKVVENIIIFMIFTTIYILSKNHSLFSQVNWLLIYIMIISITYNIRQGTLSVLLASAVYLFTNQGNLFAMTNFYSYIENVIVIVEFIFFGLIIGYTVDILHEEKRISEEKVQALQTSYESLKEISDKNILIKNEYEKRVLDGKNGIHKLYSIISKINIFDLDRMYMEILNVVSELIHTDTIAVYKAEQDTSCFRLIATLNEKSLVENRSWDLEKYPRIKEAMEKNQIYEGDPWEKEPALVLPVVSQKDSLIIIVIKEVPMEHISLYSINMLRTLVLLISQSIEKAYRYDEAIRGQRYVENTNILKPREFKKALEFAKEKKHRDLTDFILLKIPVINDIVQTYGKVSRFFREIDLFGMDGNGDLYVLLNYSSEDDEALVVKRLNEKGVCAEPVLEFQVGES